MTPFWSGYLGGCETKSSHGVVVPLPVQLRGDARAVTEVD